MATRDAGTSLPWLQKIERKYNHELANEAGRRLIVADSYNHKLKRLDPVTDECRTRLGGGEPGYQDGDD